MDELTNLIKEFNAFLENVEANLKDRLKKEDDMSIPEDIDGVVDCLAKLINMPHRNVEIMLNNMYLVYDRLVFDVLNRAMAIEMDKQYEDNIKDYVMKDNTFYTIDPMDMEIYENKQSELSRVYFSMEAIYRTEDDCNYALDILKNFRKLSCLTKK